MTAENSMKTYTVGSLLLQTVVLFGLAVFAWRSSLTRSWDFARGLDLMVTSYFAVLFVVALWLTGEHHSKVVSRRILQLWAVICIVLSLISLFASLVNIIFYYSIQSIANLASVVLFLVPPSLVLLFSTMENSRQGAT